MSKAMLFHRYYELMRTGADARLADSHSDQQFNELLPKSLVKVVAICSRSSSGNPIKLKWSHQPLGEAVCAARGWRNGLT